jgi:RNA 2',3'-cyclic 3'-phosphodiesterase
MSIRVFVAVEPDAALRERLHAVQETLRVGVDGVKWVAPRHAHLTLAFIGDVPDTMAPLLGKALDRVAAAACALTCPLAGIGLFGRPAAPRVVWAGFPRVPAGLSAMHTALNAELTALGLAVDARPFRPHLTLGRVKSGRGRTALRDHVRRLADVRIGALRVDRLVLVQSVLTPTGPVYSVLHRAPLRSA